jgi:hypothetical protein
MRRDTELVNDVYLERYDYDSGTYVFYFNYVFDDFPVFLSDGLKRSLDSIDACIEVKVDRGRVSHYRRYVVRLEERRVMEIPDVSIETATRELDRIYWGSGFDLIVDFVDLAYFLDAAGANTGLSLYAIWRVVPYPATYELIVEL